MGAGALSPVKGFSTLAASVGGGLFSGAITSIASEVEDLMTRVYNGRYPSCFNLDPISLWDEPNIKTCARCRVLGLF